MPPQDPNVPDPNMTDAELRLHQADTHQASTESLLETMIKQNDANNPVPVLEHLLTTADETRKAVEKSSLPTTDVAQFMKTFVETVEKVKGEKGEDAVVDYEKVVAEAVPKVEEAIKGDTALMESFKAKPEDVAKELQNDKAFLDSIKAADVDPAEVAHTLRNTPYFIEQLRNIPEMKGEPGAPGTSETVDYAKVVSMLKGDVDFVALTKGEPGAIVRGKTTGAKELMDYISSRTGDDRLSYNSLKDTPNFDLYRPKGGGGAGYLREIADVDVTGLATGQVLAWNSTLNKWTPVANGGTTSPLTTKGDLYGFSTVNARIPVGADGQVLTADSTQALGVKWAATAGGQTSIQFQDEGSNLGATGTVDTVDFVGAGVTATRVANKVTVTIGGGGSTPTGTGFTHITAGAQDAAAKLVDTADINNSQVTLAKIANVATDVILGRATAGAGVVEELTALPFAFTGDVTRAADSNAQTIAASAVTLAKMADVATATVFYRKTAGSGAPEVQTLATLKTDLGLTGTNSGDQTFTASGDATAPGSTSNLALTLATVNANVGSFGLAASVAQFTVNAKGLITAAANVAISIVASQVSDFSAAVRAVTLTGLSLATSQVIAATDTVLLALGYLQAQITALTAVVAGKVASVGATSPITSTGGTTPVISTSMATNKLIGRGTAGTGVMEEITLGTNLSFTGTTLNAASGPGTATTDYTTSFMFMGG